MKNVQWLTERIAEEIRAGSFGESGAVFPTLELLGKKYGIAKSSMVTVRQKLAEQGSIEIVGKSAFINNGRARSDSPYMQSRKPTNCIGVIVPRFESLFFSAFCDELSEWLHKNGYSTLFVSSVERAEREALQTIKRAGVDGIVVAATDQRHIISMFERFPLPCVLIGARGENIRLSSVDEDPFNAAKRIAKQFIAEGCKNFCILRSKKYKLSNDSRTNGFLEGLAEEGIFVSPDNIIEHEASLKVSLRAIIERIRFEKEKTGVLLYNTIGLPMFLELCCEKNLLLHRNMEVASFQDVHKSSHEEFPIIIAKTSTRNLAVCAGQEIIRQIKDDTAVPQTFKIPYQIYWNGIEPK